MGLKVTTDEGTFECNQEQANAMKLLQRAINSIAKGHTVGFYLVETDPQGRLRSTLTSLTGEHLDKMAEAAGEARIEMFHLGALWEGNAPLSARSIRNQ